MNCEEILALYEVARDAEFRGELFESVKRHLDECQNCQKRINAMSELDQPIAAALASIAPSSFERKVMSAVQTRQIDAKIPSAENRSLEDAPLLAGETPARPKKADGTSAHPTLLAHPLWRRFIVTTAAILIVSLMTAFLSQWIYYRWDNWDKFLPNSEYITRQKDAQVLDIASVSPNLQTTEALLTTASGPVAVWSDKKSAWIEKQAGENVSGLLRTGSDTKAEVAFCGARLNIEGGARTKITTKDGRVDLRLEQGSLRVAALEQTPWSVACGEVVFAGKGGDAKFSTDSQGSIARVAKGMVAARSRAGKENRIDEGQAARFKPSGEYVALTETQPTTASPNSVAIATIESPSLGQPSAMGALAVPVVSRAGAGRLVVKDESGREAGDLELRECKVDARIVENVAYTQVALTFWNNTNRRAEGTFYYTLPEGAAICRLALEVSPDNWMEGEMVERGKARKVYEDIVRRMQDPALMEWQKGNLFKTRIFPIPPNGPKRLIIGYTQALTGRYGQMRYAFPVVSDMTAKTPIRKFEMTMDMETAIRFRNVSVPAYPDAQIKSDGSKVHLQIIRENFHPERDVLALFERERLGQTPLVSAFHLPGEDGYFLISVEPRFAAAGSLNGEIAIGRDALFLVDTSLSRRGPEGVAQARALSAFLKELGPSDRFRVVAFDVSPIDLVDDWSSGDDAREHVLAKLAAILPLGGTNLSAAFDYADKILRDRNDKSRRLDVVLLTDGIATMGEQERATLITSAKNIFSRQNARLHALALGSNYDGLLLRSICRDANGRFAALSLGDNIESEIFKLAVSLDEAMTPPLSVKFSDVKIKNVYPSELESLPEGQEILLVGRYEKKGRFCLKLSTPGDDANEETYIFDLPGDANVSVGEQSGQAQKLAPQKNQDFNHLESNEFLPPLWARMRMDHLMMQTQSNEVVKEIITLAETYCLMSPYTSFLALESEKQYEEYGIDRKKRRRFWDANDRWAPPVSQKSELVQSPPPPAETQDKTQPKDAPTPKSFRLADMDISHLLPRGASDRIVATALATLCLEVYYRYVKLAVSEVQNATPTTVSPSNRAVVSHFVRTDNVKVTPPTARVEITMLPEERPLERSILAENETMGIRRIRRRSGSRYSESSVDIALEYISQNQSNDDSFGSDEVATTSLALLSFLGTGHTEKVGKYKTSVQRGCGWLIKKQDANGQLSDCPIEHAIATLALCEAAAMGRIQNTITVAQKAIDYMLSLQGANGGFAAEAGGIPDTWATLWFVLAMKSAKIAGLQIKSKAFERVIDFLNSVGDNNFFAGMTAKPDTEHFDAHATAAHCVARMMLGCATEKLRESTAIQRLSEDVPQWGGAGEKVDYALWYMKQLLFFQMGGDIWSRWNNALKTVLLNHQEKTGEHVGSWPAVGFWRFNFHKPIPTTPITDAEVLSAFRNAVDEPNNEALREALIAKIRQVADENLLVRLSESAPIQSPVGRIARARLALHLYTRQQWARAVEIFASLAKFEEYPKNLLALWLDCLWKIERYAQALELIHAEINAGRADAWLCVQVAERILDPKSGITDPKAYIHDHYADFKIPGAAAVHHIAGQLLLAKGEMAKGAEILKNLYEASESCDEYLQNYYEALIAAGRGEEALQRFAFEAQRGLFDDRRQAMVTDLLWNVPSVKTKPDEFIKQFTPGSAIRVFCLKHCAAKAKEKQLWNDAANYYEEIYRTRGQRFEDAWSYLEALRQSAQTAKALAELERMIRCGYDDDRAYTLLLDVYREIGRDARDLLRAASSAVEARADVAENHTFLMKFYESIGETKKALESGMLAFKARPEDPIFGRQAADKALAAKDYAAAEQILFILLDTTWEPKFGDIWGPVERDILALIETRRKAGDAHAVEILEKRLRVSKIVDIEVQVKWDTATDVDTHVIEPGGVECSYQRRSTPKGGILDRDVTNGTGPETYMLKRAQPGLYIVDVVQYSGDVSPQKPTVATIRITTKKYGQDEKSEEFKVTLTNSKERKRIKTIEW